MRLNKKHHLLWCKVPKAGSTSWSVIMEQLLGISSKYNEEGKQMWNDIHNILRDTNDFKMTDQLIKNKFTIGFNGKYPDEFKLFHSFIIVRHPIDRLYSAYRDKIVVNKRKYAFVTLP